MPLELCLEPLGFRPERLDCRLDRPNWTLLRKSNNKTAELDPMSKQRPSWNTLWNQCRGEGATK